MQCVRWEATRSGAVRIYASATPSASAVGCYQSLGFDLAEHVNAELSAHEPDDVHMVRVLESRCRVNPAAGDADSLHCLHGKGARIDEGGPLLIEDRRVVWTHHQASAA